MCQPSACQIILDPHANEGAWNMAVDEALLEAAIARKTCVLRWYQWSQATLSLGYFQDASRAAAFPHLASLPMVRRLSGGGAILHHHELTYSCAIPATHPLARSPQALYERVHEKIITVLARHGIAARICGKASDDDEPFLCFGRSDPRDVVFQGRKIVGSAQRRRRGAIVQHGSLLLRQSQFAPYFPGVWDLAGSDETSEPELIAELAATMSGLFGTCTSPAMLSREDRARAEILRRERYSTVDWKAQEPKDFRR